MSELILQDVIPWQSLEGLDHFQFHVLHVDDDHERAEVLFKFDANIPIVLHRHCSLNKLLVLQGEHIFYRPDGSVKEVRPTGRFTVVKPDEEPHSESGGSEGAMVLFSIYNREDNGPLYELMDPEKNIVGTLSMDDLAALSQTQ